MNVAVAALACRLLGAVSASLTWKQRLSVPPLAVSAEEGRLARIVVVVVLVNG